MKSFLESNLEILARRQADLAQLIRTSDLVRVEIFPSSSGHPTARYTRIDGQTVQLHSRYNPLQEARKSLERTPTEDSDYFILLGFGLGYGMDALVEKAGHPDNRYFIVESDLEILRAAFESRDLAHILSLEHIHFAWPNSGAELARQWDGFFDLVGARQTAYITPPPLLALNPSLFKSAAETIQSQIYQSFTDINTLLARLQTFLDNFIENLPRAIASPGVSRFAGSMRGVPAILVSAGPSLDKNIHELCGMNEKVLVLSTDTALKPLLAAGVEPDFILTGDPTVENYRHLQGADIGSGYVVAEATAFPAVFEEFSGRTIACTYENSSLRALSDFVGEKGDLRAWGSVATMALDFALRLGCNPIIFVGQDLAHSDGRTYCSGTYFEKKWFKGVSTPEEWSRRWEELRAGKKTVTMIDIFGHEIESTDKLASYWNWINKEIQSRRETTFINATEGGILKDGVVVISLREALARHCNQDLDLRIRVEERFGGAREPHMDKAGSVYRRLRSECEQISRCLVLGRRLARGEPGSKPEGISLELEAVKNAMNESKSLMPVLDCFNQMGTIEFLRNRKSVSRLPPGRMAVEALQKAYCDYFDSVRQSLNLVESALDRIQSALGLN